MCVRVCGEHIQWEAHGGALHPCDFIMLPWIRRFFFRILVHLCANKNVQELRFLTRSLTASLSKHHVRPHSCGVIANCGFHIDLKGSAADVASNRFRVLEFHYHSTKAERQADSLVLVTSMTS